MRCEWWRFFATAQDPGGPLPSIDVADALLDERGELTRQFTVGVRRDHNPSNAIQVPVPTPGGI
jgi:hypothetical protein